MHHRGACRARRTPSRSDPRPGRLPIPDRGRRGIAWGPANGDRMRWRGTAVEGPGAPAQRRVGVLVAVAALVYAADVISKVIVVATLRENVPVRVIGSLLQLDYLRNPGA